MNDEAVAHAVPVLSLFKSGVNAILTGSDPLTDSSCRPLLELKRIELRGIIQSGGGS